MGSCHLPLPASSRPSRQSVAASPCRHAGGASSLRGRRPKSAPRPGSNGSARSRSAARRPGGSFAACGCRHRASTSSPGIPSSAAAQPCLAALGHGPARGCPARGARVSAREPGAPRMAIGDLSRPHGGDFGAAVRLHRPREPPERARRGRLLPARRRARAAPRDASQIDPRLSQDLVDRFLAAGARRSSSGRTPGYRTARRGGAAGQPRQPPARADRELETRRGAVAGGWREQAPEAGLRHPLDREARPRTASPSSRLARRGWSGSG